MEDTNREILFQQTDEAFESLLNALANVPEEEMKVLEAHFKYTPYDRHTLQELQSLAVNKLCKKIKKAKRRKR